MLGGIGSVHVSDVTHVCLLREDYVPPRFMRRYYWLAQFILRVKTMLRPSF